MKNYQKKQRKNQREAYKEIRNMVHDKMIKEIPLPKDFKEKEAEVYDAIYR